jgi:hypothetical protein
MFRNIDLYLPSPRLRLARRLGGWLLLCAVTVWAVDTAADVGEQPAAMSDNPAMAHEVDALIDAVAQSGCEFMRNGSWYGAQGAQAHLRDKFVYLHTRRRIHSAEQFIEQAATRSAVSGQPYAMRCAGVTTSTHQWLSERLVQLRTPR